MKRWLAVAMAAVLLVGGGCASTGSNADSGTLLGAALGAGAGAIVGNQSGHSWEGAALGAGLGALTGGLMGSALDASEARAEAAEVRAEQALYEVERSRGVSILDVIRMSQAGVSDRVIAAKIDQTGSTYDLSAQEIIDLQSSGVSDRVIEHMIRTTEY